MKHISDFKDWKAYLEWYNQPATPKQIAYCEKLGKCMSDPVGWRGWTMGDCDKWIDELKSGEYWLCERA